MKKSDLKIGNVIELRNGGKWLVSLCKDETGFIHMHGNNWASKSTLTDDLKLQIGYCTSSLCNDVVKIYKDYTCQEVLWERKEKPELSAHDRYVLTGLHKMYLDWYIARDKNGDVSIYSDKPHKVGMWFFCDGDWEYEHLTVYNEIFKNIKWEDDEVYTIRELLGE